MGDATLLDLTPLSTVTPLSTRVCSGESLNTRLLVWCSNSAEVAPYLGSNSTFLSELKVNASRYTAARSA